MYCYNYNVIQSVVMTTCVVIPSLLTTLKTAFEPCVSGIWLRSHSESFETGP